MNRTGCTKLELIYRGNRDGSKNSVFHNKCDNQGPTVCLYKNEKGNIFGGYASISWTNSGNGHSAPDSFIFTLTNNYGTEPNKFHNTNVNNSVYHTNSTGPCFYDDIWFCEDFRSNKKKSSGYTTFPRAYKDTLNKGKSIFTGDNNDENGFFILTEIEVFKIFK